MQEATVMQADADEVSSTVGRSTNEYATAGHKVVNLEVEKLEVTIKSHKQGTRSGECFVGIILGMAQPLHCICKLWISFQ